MRNPATGINAATAQYEAVTVLNRPMLFTYAYIDPATVPKGMYQYAVLHHSEDVELPIQLCDWAAVNRYGTLLSSHRVVLLRDFGSRIHTCDIDPNKDWVREGYETTLEKYLMQNPARSPRKQEYER